jgi:hypothetical protein
LLRSSRPGLVLSGADRLQTWQGRRSRQFERAKPPPTYCGLLADPEQLIGDLETATRDRLDVSGWSARCAALRRTSAPPPYSDCRTHGATSDELAAESAEYAKLLKAEFRGLRLGLLIELNPPQPDRESIPNRPH